MKPRLFSASNPRISAVSTGDAQSPARAAHRFWDVPELVYHLLTFLDRDRIDLLSLSLVSKTLRVQSLKTWAKHLDLPAAVASDRLNFFKANPSLLTDVQFLRVRSRYDKLTNEVERHDESPRKWRHLNMLLQMLAECPRPTSELPVLDLAVSPFDLLRLPNVLKQRVVSLRVLTGILSSCQPLGTLEQHNSEAFEIHEHENASHTFDQRPEATSIHSNRAVAQKCWKRLSDIITQATRGPGLRVFRITANSQCDAFISSAAAVEEIFQQVVQHAATLQELFVDLGDLRIPSSFLLTSHFDQLESLAMKCNFSDQWPMIETFLDGAKALRALKIWIDEPSSVTLWHTFPYLRWIEVLGPCLIQNERRAFAERHPNVLSPDGERALHRPPSGFSSSSVTHNLSHAYICQPDRLQLLSEKGCHLAHIIIALETADIFRRLVSLLQTTSEAARKLRCLQLCGFRSDDNGHIMLRSLGLPCFSNLVELHLTPIHDEPDASQEIGRLMALLTPARSLKVLRTSLAETRLPHKTWLHNNVFPPSLEYFCWEYLTHDVPQYFRFVTSDPEGGVIKTASGGKRGYLQRVPAMFRTPITKAGVWRRSFDAVRDGTSVLDHVGVPGLLLP